MTSKEQEHVMISYNWQHQTLAKRINNELENRGYKTWIDLTDMRGTINQVTAEAIETAAVVLCCVTRAFKESRSCEKEANYADKLNKAIIPLQLEKNVVFDGWIGIIAGKELVFDFSDQVKFNASMHKLDVELSLRGLKHGKGSQSSATCIDTFDVEDVCQWLKGMKLTDEVISVFRKNCVTGEELVDFTEEMLTGEDFGLTRYAAKKILDKRDQAAKPSTKQGGITPSLLTRVSKEIPVKEWKFVGRELGLDDKTLDRIEKDNRDNVLEQVYKMLQQWSDSTPGASEQVLCDVLSRMNISITEKTDALYPENVAIGITSTEHETSAQQKVKPVSSSPIQEEEQPHMHQPSSEVDQSKRTVATPLTMNVAIGISASEQDTSTQTNDKPVSRIPIQEERQPDIYRPGAVVGQSKMIVEPPSTTLLTKGTVRKITGKRTKAGQLKNPMGLFRRNNGDFVVCDRGNNRVVVLDSELNYKNVIQFTSFDHPFGPVSVAVSNNGTFYIVDCVNKILVICTEKGKIIAVLRLTYYHERIKPWAICLSSGYLYVTDMGNGCVHCIDVQSYKIVKSSHKLTEGWLTSICVNAKGQFVISDYSAKRCIHVLDKDLLKLTQLSHHKIRDPRGLCLDEFDNLYVCDGWKKEGEVLQFNSQNELVSQVKEKDVYDADSIVATKDFIAWTEYWGDSLKILYH